MNKNKIILSSIGGVALVAAAVLGYLLWSAYDEKSEMESELETAKENVQRANSAKVAPSQASVDAIDANRKMLDAWRAETMALASSGDRAVDASVTPESFKKKMADDARELRKLPGGAGKPLVGEEFGFGFKDYIAGGKMPEKDKLAAMQRQWDEVGLFVRTLSEVGAVEVLDVAVVDAQAAEQKPEEGVVRRGQRGRQRRGAEEETEKSKVSEQSYVLKFLARPAALVGALNAFATCERFVAVDNCSFARADDTLAAMLGGKDKKDGQRPSARTGRRRARPTAAEEPKEGEEDAQKKGLVTDPEADMPFTVTLKITTFDFGTGTAGAGAAAPAQAEPAAAEASKESKEEEE